MLLGSFECCALLLGWNEKGNERSRWWAMCDDRRNVSKFFHLLCVRSPQAQVFVLDNLFWIFVCCYCRESLVRMNGGFVVNLPLFVLAALNNRMMKNILFDEGRVSFNNKHCGAVESVSRSGSAKNACAMMNLRWWWWGWCHRGGRSPQSFFYWKYDTIHDGVDTCETSILRLIAFFDLHHISTDRCCCFSNDASPTAHA